MVYVIKLHSDNEKNIFLVTCKLTNSKAHCKGFPEAVAIIVSPTGDEEWAHRAFWWAYHTLDGRPKGWKGPRNIITLNVKRLNNTIEPEAHNLFRNWFSDEILDRIKGKVPEWAYYILSILLDILEHEPFPSYSYTVPKLKKCFKGWGWVLLAHPGGGALIPVRAPTYILPPPAWWSSLSS